MACGTEELYFKISLNFNLKLYLHSHVDLSSSFHIGRHISRGSREGHNNDSLGKVLWQQYVRCSKEDHVKTKSMDTNRLTGLKFK